MTAAPPRIASASRAVRNAASWGFAANMRRASMRCSRSAGSRLGGEQPAAQDVGDGLARLPGVHRGGQARHRVVDPGHGDVLLGREVHRDRPGRDLGRLGYVGDRGRVVAAFREQLLQRRQRRLASPAVWGFLAAGTVLLAAFAYIETRARQPLLPLRIVRDRNRGASYLSILITGAGMFGIFLFLTYYLQETLGFSPVMAGVAFLPMVGAIIVCSNLANIVLLPRVGPRWLVAPGMLAAAAGLAWLTRIGVHSSYAADVLPPLLLASAGLGFVMSPSMNTGTAGVAPSDAGAASAVVNTGQQVGSSIGTSLLNTMAASAAASYLASHLSPRLLIGGHPAPALVELAQVHSYTTTFWWAAGMFAAGSVVAALLFRRGVPAASAAPAGERPA